MSITRRRSRSDGALPRLCPRGAGRLYPLVATLIDRRTVRAGAAEDRGDQEVSMRAVAAERGALTGADGGDEIGLRQRSR
jgi:hypothetical protein